MLGLVARDRVRLEEVAAALPGETAIYSGDVRDEAFNATVAQAAAVDLGAVDVWICNAGISPISASVADTQPNVWRSILETNLTAAFLGAQAAARVMRSGGRIIFTGSVLGERPRAGLSAYSASKAGLIGLMKSTALDLAPVGITSNLVAPGWFDSQLAAPWKNNESLSRQIRDHTAARRWGVGVDLPAIYLYLASSASAFVTGVVIPVDGGYLLS